MSVPWGDFRSLTIDKIRQDLASRRYSAVDLASEALRLAADKSQSLKIQIQLRP